MIQLFCQKVTAFSQDFAGEILIGWAQTNIGNTLYHMKEKTADTLKGLSKLCSFFVSKYIAFSQDFAGDILIGQAQTDPVNTFYHAQTDPGDILYHMKEKIYDALKGLSE